MENITIGQRIKDLRTDADLTQVEMANKLGIDQSYYAKYENGKQTIPTRHLWTICNTFAVSTDYI